MLRKEGFEVAVAETGPAALEDFDRAGADLVLLDLMLPGLSGTEVCRELRTRSTVPVIMLTARDSEVDKVVGLELGADDYVTKPFSHRELVARIRAVLRRQGGAHRGGRRPGGRPGPDGRRPAPGDRRRASRSSSRSRSSTCSSCCCATPAGCSPAASSSTGSGAATTSATPRRSTSTSSGCAPRSSPTRLAEAPADRPRPGLQVRALSPRLLRDLRLLVAPHAAAFTTGGRSPGGETAHGHQEDNIDGGGSSVVHLAAILAPQAGHVRSLTSPSTPGRPGPDRRRTTS